MFFFKLATFFISSTRCIFTKLLGVSESSRTLLVILLILQQLFSNEDLHGNEIVQYLQNYKDYIVVQDDFRKPS